MSLICLYLAKLSPRRGPEGFAKLGDGDGRPYGWRRCRLGEPSYATKDYQMGSRWASMENNQENGKKWEKKHENWWKPQKEGHGIVERQPWAV